MPIPFRDLSEEADLGLAGYLRFVEEPDGKGIRAALFLVNGRGEPIDFTFNRVEIARPFLWRAGEPRRHALRALSKSLFTACAKEPVLLLALAEDVPPRVFTDDIEVMVPLCRIARQSGLPHAASEILESLGDSLELYWVGQAPPLDSATRRVLDCLRSRQSLTEPFDRAAAGIEEAFKEP